MMDIEDEIAGYIRRDILDDEDSSALPPDVSLMDGLLDSFGLLQLITFLEERYGVTIPNREVVRRNFDSTASVARLITEKLGANPGELPAPGSRGSQGD
jgi:acyl carrier protein